MVVTVNDGDSLILPMTDTRTTTSLNNTICKPSCYKLIIAIVLVFPLMQFTVNFIAYKHKFNKSQLFPINCMQLSSWESNRHSVNNSLNNDIRRTPNTINSKTGSIFNNVSDLVITYFNDINITTTSSLQLCPIIPPKLSKTLFSTYSIKIFLQNV